MIKRLSARHLSLIRRLIVGQTHVEIEQDLGISQSRISVLLDDPLFNAKYQEMQEKTMGEFLEVRASAMEILQEASPDAARTVVKAFREGTINGKTLGVGSQLDSAFDVLNRTGNKKIERGIVGVIDLGQLIADAYRDKHGDSSYADEVKNKVVEKTDSAFDVLDIIEADVTEVVDASKEA